MPVAARLHFSFLSLFCLLPLALSSSRHEQSNLLAIVGATVIDGNGGPAMPDATILIRGKRIVAVGPRSAVPIPRGARRIDADGKFVTPGFIDTNVHLSLLGGDESLLRYWDRETDVMIEAAQKWLKRGVTTLNDSWGLLPQLSQVRDAINRGDLVGPRLLIAGNILGWGGLGSVTLGGEQQRKTRFRQSVNEALTQNMGENLLYMTPDALRSAMNIYLDKGPDFIKYGATSHINDLITFSPRLQEVIVTEAHKRGKWVQVHATGVEGLRMAVLAGVDLVQHPEIHNVLIPDELVRLLRDRGVFCSINAGSITGKAWVAKMKQQRQVSKGVDRWQENTDLEGFSWPLLSRPNAEKLIRGGCIVTAASDAGSSMGDAYYDRPAQAEDWGSELEWDKPGLGTIRSIEGLVELGMTPSQALVAATKHGAMASHGLSSYGTVEKGKLADLLVLDADPLTDIKNIESLSLVIKEGEVVDNISR
jgi:imidazolonepropionase-like amidohydrolase